MDVVTYPQFSWFLLVKAASVLSDKIIGITQICTFSIDGILVELGHACYHAGSFKLSRRLYVSVSVSIHGTYSTISR